MVKPVSAAPDPSEEDLMHLPNARMAMKGVQNLQLECCYVSGLSVLVKPEKLGVFGQATPDVRKQLEELLEEHKRNYSVPVSESSVPDANVPVKVEGKDTPADKVKEDPAAGADGEEDVPRATEYKSMDELKASGKITPECKLSGTGVKGVMVLIDCNSKTAYMVSLQNDIVIKPLTHLGGIGGGSLLDSNDDEVNAVKWELVDGDQTVVQLAANKKDSPPEAGAPKEPKFSTETLYAVIRKLESKATKAIKITSYGEVLAVTKEGKHGYEFGTPPSHPNHRHLEYVLNEKPGTKTTPGNAFAPLTNKDTGLGKGPLLLVWRVGCEPVSQLLKPQKVQVVTKSRIELKKDEPVMVAWQ